MRYLLDTHVVLWWLDNKSPLRKKHRDLINDPISEVFVSAASIWETSIKCAKGRLTTPDDFVMQLKLSKISILPVTAEHAYAVRSLPSLHGDPFDKMLVVQALIEDLIIMTRDKNVASYSVPCIMV